jgi:uncharacterized protein (TIGR03437 family)
MTAFFTPHSPLFRPRGRFIFFVLFLLLGVIHEPRVTLLSRAASADQPTGARQRVAQNFGKLPLSFEAGRSSFRARGLGYDLALTATGSTLLLQQPDASFARLRMQLAGANPHARGGGLEELPGKSHYFIGADPQQWRTGVPHFARVRYEQVYPQIDLVYYGAQHELEYDFIVQPGGDVNAIKLRFEGARQLGLADNGDLVLQFEGGELRQRAPQLYQERHGRRYGVPGRYVLLGRNQVGFAVGAYDTRLPLVIDPVLSYASYLGAASTAQFYRIALDGAGNIYLGGRVTETSREPAGLVATPGALQSKHNGGFLDGCVMKLNPSATAILYTTYLGSANADSISGLEVDAVGNLVLSGLTNSRNFPVKNGFQTELRSNVNAEDVFINNAFITKLNPQGNQLLYSSYFFDVDNLHGKRTAPRAMAVAGSKVYLAGSSDLKQDPTLETLKNGWALVVDTNQVGAASKLFAMNLRGAECAGIAVDGAGKVFLSGYANAEFRRTRAPSGPIDDSAFVAKLDPAQLPATALVFSASLGSTPASQNANPPIQAGRLVVDASGNLFVIGTTVGEIQTTPTAFRTTRAANPGATEGYVLKFGPDGGLLYASYLAAAQPADLLLVDTDQLYLIGRTSSANFPTTADAFQRELKGAGDAVICKLDLRRSGAAALLFATYFGGAGASFRETEGAYSLTKDNAGNVYIVGGEVSADLPVTGTALQAARLHQANGFLLKLAAAFSPEALRAVNVSAASYAGARLAAELIVTAFGSNLAMSTQSAATGLLPTELAGTTVRLRDSAGQELLAPLFFVSPAQVNYLVPPGVALGEAQVLITNRDGGRASETLRIAPVAPGLFSADSSGRGLAAAVALRIQASGAQRFEPVARFDPAQNKFVAPPLDLGPEGEQVFLLLFGTGLRGRSSLANVSATLGGVLAEISFGGAQGNLAGLDQVNLRLPRTLAGRGEVNLVLTVEGQTANSVKILVK